MSLIEKIMNFVRSIRGDNIVLHKPRPPQMYTYKQMQQMRPPPPPPPPPPRKVSSSFSNITAYSGTIQGGAVGSAGSFGYTGAGSMSPTPSAFMEGTSGMVDNSDQEERIECYEAISNMMQEHEFCDKHGECPVRKALVLSVYEIPTICANCVHLHKVDLFEKAVVERKKVVARKACSKLGENNVDFPDASG